MQRKFLPAIIAVLTSALCSLSATAQQQKPKIKARQTQQKKKNVRKKRTKQRHSKKIGKHWQHEQLKGKKKRRRAKKLSAQQMQQPTQRKKQHE